MERRWQGQTDFEAMYVIRYHIYCQLGMLSVFIISSAQTVVNGTEHYPTGLARISLGIWDASSPEGTSDWGKGPINWNKAPNTISATVRGVWLECSS